MLPLMAPLLSATQLFSQTVVTGKVRSADGKPLAAANVVVLENQLGAATGKGGDFKLPPLEPGNYTLQASYLGFEKTTRALKITGNRPVVTVDFKLETSAATMEALVVSGTRANRKTPMTFLNLPQRALDENNLGQDLPILLQWTPSAVSTSDAGTGIGYTGIRIRGTDPTRVNVTINGIPLNDAESQGVFWVNLPDFVASTENIQIQRGVGGSTNGAGAFGATINLNTVQQKRDPFAEVNVSGGSFRTFRRNVAFGSGLLNDRFSVEGRLSKINSDGYIDRATADLSSYYLSTAYQTDATMLRFNLFSGQERTYQAWYGVPGALIDDRDTRTFNSAGTEKPGEPYEDEVDNYGQTHYQLLFNHAFNPTWRINAALHYTQGAGFFEQYKADQDFAFYGLTPIEAGQEVVRTTDLIRRLWLDNDFYGGIYGIHYDAESAPLALVLGGGYHIYGGDHFGEITWAEFASDSEKDQRYYENDARKIDFNTYAKLTYDFLPNLFGYLDVQYRRVDYEFLGRNLQGNPVDQQVELHFFNPKVGLKYDLPRGASVYVSFAVGQREPNRNDYVESTVNSRPEPETLYDTEVGYRREWGRAQLEVVGYYMYYRDQLVLNGEVNDVGAYTRINVDRSYRLGIELSGAYRLNDRWRVSGNGTLSRNKVNAFTEFLDRYDAEGNLLPGQETVRHEDTDLAFSPGIVAAGELSYRPLDDLWLSLLGKYVSRQFIDNTSDEDSAIDPYFFANLRVEYNLPLTFTKGIRLTAMVRNVFDSLYETNAYNYRAVYDGAVGVSNFYFPQATRNYLVGMEWQF